MHELSGSQWAVLGLLGLCVGGFTAGASYVLQEFMFRRRTAKWDAQLKSPDAPVDIVDQAGDADGGA